MGSSPASRNTVAQLVERQPKKDDPVIFCPKALAPFCFDGLEVLRAIGIRGDTECRTVEGVLVFRMITANNLLAPNFARPARLGVCRGFESRS